MKCYFHCNQDLVKSLEICVCKQILIKTSYSFLLQTKREPDDGCYGEDIDDPIVELLPLTAGYDISPDSMQEENTKQNGIGLDKLEEAYLERPESERSSSLSDPAIRCGYFTYSPDWLQYWNNPKSLLFFLCCLSMVQGTLKLLYI